ncbi:MAG: tRNA pseudouridine(55) synthase TruB [Actinomycetota bacterium]|jgi:tRNA pseudouridine55 synthase
MTVPGRPDRGGSAGSPGSHGIVVVDKPEGPTSHAIVGRARKAWGTRRVGHAGTLDPLATGVLVLGIGSATRLLGHLSAQGKEYVATMALGVATISDDAQGDVVSAAGATLTGAEIEAAMAPWRGSVRQRPNAVSAVHIDGRRAHERVRAGEDVDVPERDVTIDAFDLLDLRHDVVAGVTATVIDVRVSCSAGTYVRALARDVGAALGVGGHVMALRRTRSGAFTLDDACVPDDMGSVTPMSSAEAARRSLPWVEIDADSVRAVTHGVRIPWPQGAAEEGTIAFVHGDDLLALAERRGDTAAYSAVFPPDAP